MKNTMMLGALVALLATVGASSSQAELVFSSANGSVLGEVRVTQTQLSGDWVNLVIELQTSQTFDTISGGFRPLGGAVFSQGAGELDTRFQFFDATGFGFNLGLVDTPTELSVQTQSQIGGTFGPANQFNSFAQLVLAPGTSAEVFSLPLASGVSASEFALIQGGNVVGTLSGTVTAIPEPSTLTGLALLSLGWFGCGSRRRRRLAIAA